jgi:YggT family protein
MVIYLAKVIHWIFLIYTILLILRILGSWVPRLAYHRAMQFVRFYTEPYLGLFRRLIPPIGGTLDLSPIIAFFALSIIERVVMSFLSAFL